ncbi:MAG: hypothetical protein BWK78_01595 [Thiotrichaceae bacterium IS1]|nr:MAG: hypothetical protein BWK78_01595 [Thiotrichaceae bacterium IS1]
MTSATFFFWFIFVFLPVLTALFVGIVVYLTIQEMKSLKRTVSFFGREILTDPLLGREKELRRLANKILTGQSSAIIGAFDRDRTAILNYLQKPDDPGMLYGNQADKLIFSYVDVSTLKIDCTLPEFWERTLKPLQEKIANDKKAFSLQKVYQDCQDHQFDNYYLGKLFEQLQQEGLRLVLMLDRYEKLLRLPLSKHPEFGAGLRSLAASRTPSSFILIISGGITINKFHKTVWHEMGWGSPWFNFIEGSVVTLSTLSEAEIDDLLRRSVPPFTQQEEARNFVKEMAGGHPYFLQLAAGILSEAYENKETNPVESAQKTFYERTKGMLDSILQSWSPTTCRAFLALVNGEDYSNFNRELGELEKQGFVSKTEDGKWQVRAKVFSQFVKENQPRCPEVQPHSLSP